MAANLETVVQTTVDALGFDLVDLERAPRGLLRIFIDRRQAESGQITVEDCAIVSNQLSRVFLVESLEYERLEVSSPGLDRPLKTAADFRRYVGHLAKVRLFEMIDARKRFEGVVAEVGEGVVTLVLADADAKSPGKRKVNAKARAMDSVEAADAARAAIENGAVGRAGSKKITVALDNIERARLVPDI